MEWTHDEVLNFTHVLHSTPAVWDPKDKNYFNPRKEEAWITVSCQIGRDVEECKKKFDSLKGSYRRELSRMAKSKRNAKGPNDIYQSRWFAFEALRFLDDRKRTENPSDSPSPMTTPDVTPRLPRPPPPKRTPVGNAAAILINKQEDEWEIRGKSIGFQLRGIDERQGAIAQKLIADAIFYAKVGKLTDDSCIVLQPELKTAHEIEIHGCEIQAECLP